MPLIPRNNKYGLNFSGKNNYNISGSFEFVWANINSFGQIAISESGGWSGLLGLVTSVSPTVSMSFHLRNYMKDYNGISANAFGIRSGNKNEQGIYWGLQVNPSRRWVIEGYSNLYKFPLVTNQSDGSSLGAEHMIRLKYLPNKTSHISLHWRLRTRLINDDPLLPKLSHNLTNEIKQIIGLNARWSGNSKFLLQTRLQYSQVLFNHIRTTGMLASNQVSYDWDFVKLTTSMAIFETDDFDNRQYMYEKGLPYSLSIPFFDGVGLRWYFLARVIITNQIDLWLRIARTKYYDKANTGSGWDQIEGSHKTDISLQLRYKL